MKIVQYPHPSLRRKADPVTTITRELAVQVGGMLELMYQNEGLGLAAPQVDANNRVIVMNFSGDSANKDDEYVAINPVILEAKGAFDDREGCLSFPGLFSKVRRAKQVKVQAYNLKGELYEMTAVDLSARIWQHEIDHLDGILFIDKMGMLGRLNSRKAIQEFIEDFERMKKKGDLPPDMEPKL
jgi:peptide deformylase